MDTRFAEDIPKGASTGSVIWLDAASSHGESSGLLVDVLGTTADEVSSRLS